MNKTGWFDSYYTELILFSFCIIALAGYLLGWLVFIVGLDKVITALFKIF